MKKPLIFLACLFGFLSMQSFIAQNRFSIEVHGNASTATHTFGGAELDPGFGLEGMLEYRFMPHIGAYGGWGWNTFSADESFAGFDINFNESGYAFGLQFNHPMGKPTLAYYIRAGAIYRRIEVENKEADLIADSGHGLGWQVGAGFDVSLGSGWHFQPGYKYHALSRTFEIESVTTPVNLNYVSFELALAKYF